MKHETDRNNPIVTRGEDDAEFWEVLRQVG